jgi:hypothetical protein
MFFLFLYLLTTNLNIINSNIDIIHFFSIYIYIFFQKKDFSKIENKIDKNKLIINLI